MASERHAAKHSRPLDAMSGEKVRQMVAQEVRLILGSGIGAQNENVTAGDTREVMNADDVAGFLGVDRKTVYDYANRGTIPHQRLGKRLLFSRTALMSWLGHVARPRRSGKD